MGSKGTVTRWIQAVRQGDETAIAALWDRYFNRLSSYAHTRLANSQKDIGADDVASAAFTRVCNWYTNSAGDIPNRHALWKLLATAVTWSVIDHNRRAGPPTIPETDLLAAPDETQRHLLAQIACDTAGPETRAILAERMEWLLSLLDDADVRAVALAKLDEELTNDEIAEELQCSKRTVERRLSLIRKIWRRAMENDR